MRRGAVTRTRRCTCFLCIFIVSDTIHIEFTQVVKYNARSTHGRELTPSAMTRCAPQHSRKMCPCVRDSRIKHQARRNGSSTKWKGSTWCKVVQRRMQRDRGATSGVVLDFFTALAYHMLRADCAVIDADSTPHVGGERQARSGEHRPQASIHHAQ